MEYNYLDLFSGIGGFALAARDAGLPISKHFNSEIDTYANQVYAKHFPEARQLGDIRQIDGKKLRQDNPGDWLLTGGFPCQDISSAGHKRGLEGSRSGLWFDMCRIIDDIKPKYVLAENVRALTYRGLNRVLKSLAEIGYDAEWEVISANDVGAPHRRERLWLLAYPRNSDSNGIAGRLLLQFAGGGYLGDDLQPCKPSQRPNEWSEIEGRLVRQVVFW